MENFIPLSALIGGALIGVAACLLLWLNGRIAGISGIAGGGLQSIELNGSFPILLIGGLLVGVGTGIGRGCTSGHGVCGMARLSPRSIAATLVFLGVAAATVFLTRHVIA